MGKSTTGLVLTVDDDARVRTVVAWQLEAEGFAVVEAADGTAALDEIARHRPDLVVLDLSLPGWAAWTCCAASPTARRATAA